MSFRVAQTLVVGAGFSGAVHARVLAEAGHRVHVIDKRPHIAGNAFDEVGPDGVMVHRYGPHLFHTANQRVLDWVSRFAEWIPYKHRVRALLPGAKTAPMPINLDTVNEVFGTDFADAAAVQAHLARIAVPHENPRNAAEHLESRIGTVLTDLFFRTYTKKMWNLDLEEMDASVVKRLPLRFDREDTYFPTSERQILPKGGYTQLINRILDHPLITVSLDTPFDHAMTRTALHTFLSMPIDEYFGFSEGELPYRSIRFHERRVEAAEVGEPWSGLADRCSVLNFTDDGIYTRETAWHLLPGHLVHDTGARLFTREEPCDYRQNNMERFYPVKTADKHNDRLYAAYVAIAAKQQDVTFIGRCGTYRYLDMDQVINQSLMGAEAWLRARALVAA